MLPPLASAAPDPLAIPTFILAVLGFVGAVIALVWQFATFRLSGPMIKVEARSGFTTKSGTVMYRRPPSPSQLENSKVQPDGKSVIFMTVRSVGRMPAVVTDFSVGVVTNVPVFTHRGIRGLQLPLTLQPGEVAKGTIFLEFDKKYSEVGIGYVYFHLGDGRRFQAHTWVCHPTSIKSEWSEGAGNSESSDSAGEQSEN